MVHERHHHATAARRGGLDDQGGGRLPIEPRSGAAIGRACPRCP
ncbi:hypothetical protein ACFFX0_16860 [Citricoccus parietis]|uniref:Uncharacterized protein n=1 Tax=Citricoccus parietis TaxID=592307 RepID=A0ABV5G1H4_9MICC